MKTSLSIIAAMDENRLIGDNNTLPWHLPADLAFFKRTTLNKPILMGRKTYESIGRPLPGRKNIIISRDDTYQIPGCDTASSIQAALDLVQDEPEAMLIGGASLYQQTLALAETLYISEIHHQFTGDAWFPAINAAEWHEVWREKHPADERNAHAYDFVKFLRK
ncbi:MAG: type 3 dihydrofolate reductase [Gammaproteobacteria bacterium]|nr:type 3 dihydrofolate reductase [Gammaproteobacteria bacterium]MBL7000227.1 type 3 dihydrofolate reductase [Gammaproteobacteria bacterium]